jgi:hypothetical protein
VCVRERERGFGKERMVVKGSFIYDELFWGFEIIIDFKKSGETLPTF